MKGAARQERAQVSIDDRPEPLRAWSRRCSFVSSHSLARRIRGGSSEEGGGRPSCLTNCGGKGGIRTGRSSYVSPAIARSVPTAPRRNDAGLTAIDIAHACARETKRTADLEGLPKLNGAPAPRGRRGTAGRAATLVTPSSRLQSLLALASITAESSAPTCVR